MQPWQVSVGLSFAVVFTTFWYVYTDVAYLTPYAVYAWEQYGARVVMLAVAFVLTVAWLFYTVAHVFSMSDVGSRIDVLDRAIRDGRIGDGELQDALRREDTGEYLS